MSVLATLIGCSADSPSHVGRGGCEESSAPRGADEVGAGGFSPQQVYDDAAQRFGTLLVEWQPGVTPRSDVFEISFVALDASREAWTNGGEWECAPTTWMEVDVTADVSSADGEVVASGPITIRAIDLDGLVFLDMHLPATLTGDHLSNLESRLDDVSEVYLAANATDIAWQPGQKWLIGAGGTRDDSLVDEAIYYCYEDEATECLATLPEATD